MTPASRNPLVINLIADLRQNSSECVAPALFSRSILARSMVSVKIIIVSAHIVLSRPHSTIPCLLA